jgi:hypothetical protein
MRKPLSKPLTVTLFALALYAVGSSNLLAQDRPDEHHDQMPQEHHDRDARRSCRTPAHDDPVARYRHDHPHSSARCHDGFFTRTERSQSRLQQARRHRRLARDVKTSFRLEVGASSA